MNELKNQNIWKISFETSKQIRAYRLSELKSKCKLSSVKIMKFNNGIKWKLFCHTTSIVGYLKD